MLNSTVLTTSDYTEFAMNVRRHLFVILSLSSMSLLSGCTKYREDLNYDYAVSQTWQLEELPFGEIVQFESVFWEPDDTISLRDLIVNDRIAANRDVLEIGTGTGIISIVCLQHDAKRVVATDINPAAVANAKYNAAMLSPDVNLDVRQVPADSPQAYSVIKPTERFDLIISNPPWEDGVIAKPADHAFYDPGFQLMDSLLDGLPTHLNPGGRCLLAYGHVAAIKRLQTQATERNLEWKVLDDRNLDSLPADFLPGMLVEVRLKSSGKKGTAEAEVKPAE
jgi:release factor glutamine methyltransferase